MNRYFKIKNIILVLISIAAIYSCANRGQGPMGGPKDEIPPKYVQSNPDDRALNVKKQRIEIDFDENVNVKDPSKNVIISPPQQSMPQIKSYAKKVVVELNDSLMANTTYSISFGDAIEDSNEGNKLKNYVFSFATGNEIDTLQISGTVINAENQNPVSNVTVGIYSDLSDTIFTKKPFLRIARTDENGKFTIPNVHNGKYRVYALKDMNQNNFYQRGEGAAFDLKDYTTTFERVQKQDTLWKDSVTIDTIRTITVTHFMPDDIVLRYFKDDSKRQYLVKSERAEPHKISLYFNTAAQKLPEIKPLNVSWDNKYVLQKNARLDSLTYWLTDTTLINKDTINLQVNYLKTDSAYQLKPQTDTLHFAIRKIKGKTGTVSKKKELLNVQTNLSSEFDIYKPIQISFTTPIKSYDIKKMHFNELVDSTLVPLPFDLQKSDSTGMSFSFTHKWKPEATYELNIDSAAFFDVYGLNNDKVKNTMKIKSLDDYSSLRLVLANYDSTAVIQVVDKEDKVIRTIPAQKNGTTIEYLNPGDYYIRMFLDRNRNGKWDTGNFFEKMQPEEVYYYNKKLTLIKNWKFDETWDYTQTSLLKQKPKDLLKLSQQKQSDE